ncbi:MAG: response regulator [Candidatus Omnitrophota bacterium]
MGVCKILLVDDDKIILMQALKELKQTDFEVEAVESAEKAIERVKQKTFDIVFTDLVLPGMNGVELCADIKKINPKTEVVLMSGRPHEIEKIQLAFLNVGGRDESLRKPLMIDELLKVAQKICKEREAKENNP